jgi:hypothetical protein
MATSEGCCHLTGAMLNLATEAADRARIHKCPCEITEEKVTGNVEKVTRCYLYITVPFFNDFFLRNYDDVVYWCTIVTFDIR